MVTLITALAVITIVVRLLLVLVIPIVISHSLTMYNYTSLNKTFSFNNREENKIYDLVI